MRIQFGTILAAMLVHYCTFANTLYVDRARGADAAGRGSEAAPYRTIQAAVNAASSGDEIRVRPGVYDEGGGSYNGWNNRVLIEGKVLKIVSTDGKDVTHIVGGDNVRCVCFNSASGSIMEGFTIRDGEATYFVSGVDTVNGSGGGVMGVSSSSYYPSQGCVVDCVISNCVGVRGGAFRGATAVRCWITGNSASNSGGAGRTTVFVNCLVTRNSGSNSCIFDSKAVNCTVVDNERPVRQDVSLYNSVVLNNSSDGTTDDNVGSGSLDHCVTWTSASVASASSITDASPFQFIAPLYDDFRVLKGSDAETAGDASLIESAGVTVPAGVDLYKDFTGKNTIPATGTIAAGCIQTIVEPQGGAMLFSRGRIYRTRGRMAYGKDLYAFAEAFPTQFVVQAVNKGNPAIFSFIVNGAYVFPTMEDMICIVPPAVAGVVYTNDVRNPNTSYYVDPHEGSDSANGTSASTPFKTFEAVYNVVRNYDSNYHVVYATAGDYNEGSVYDGVTNRVVLRGRMRVIGAGADKSVIWGAPDPTTGGMGPNGTRCVYAYGTLTCIQGFTIRDGYVDGSTSGDTHLQRGGGVYRNSNNYNTTLHVTDCVITNCWAYRGGAGFSGAYERCHIADCHAGNGVVRYGTLVSCVMDNLAGSTMKGSGNNNQLGKAYNCTFVGRNTDEYVVCRALGTTFTNCIVMTTKELTSAPSAAGSFAWNIPTFTMGDGFTLEADLRLADVAKGDYRPVYFDRRKKADVISPVLGGGVWFDLPGFNVADYDGKPLNLAGGRPAAGAFQWPLTIREVAGICINFK